MYTLASLKEINPTNDHIDESTVAKINRCITDIEGDRNAAAPTYGDIVRYTNKYGEFSPRANVNPNYGSTKETVTLCQSGGYAHYGNHSISTAGGAWNDIDKSHFKLRGKTETKFWTWGSRGAGPYEGVNFTAKVNLWECNVNEQDYSTEFYNKQYIYNHGKPDEDGYQWFGKNMAFKKEEDYKAWLKTFRGTEVKEEGSSNNRCVVWYDKEYEHCVSLDTYSVIKGYVLDTCHCNGIRECKRVYRDDHSVDTYMTYDIPALDSRTNKAYARARAEL